MTAEATVTRAFWRASPHEVIREIDPNSSPPMAAIGGRTLREVPPGEPWIGLDGRFHAVDARAVPETGERYWVRTDFVDVWLEIERAAYIQMAHGADTNTTLGFKRGFLTGIQRDRGRAPAQGDYVTLDGILIYQG